MSKPVDGFSAPMSAGDRLAKARAAKVAKQALSVDSSDEASDDVCPDPNERPSSGMKIGNSPLRAIRAHCLDCVCGSYKEVELCTAPKCPLYPFRFGKRPATIRRKREAAAAAQETTP